MIDTLVTAAWFFVAICILVPVHEFGHFYAMRLFNIRVLRFSVGFGKRLFTWTDRHGTEFAFSAIPLGGYVKPLDQANGEVAEEDLPYTLSVKPPWQRLIVFFAGPLANLVLAVVFYWVLLFVKGTYSYSPVIGTVEDGSIAANAGLVAGQEILSIDGEETSSRKAVTLHLLTRLGESGSIRFTAAEPGSDISTEYETNLDGWLKDSEAPDPIKGLGISFYYPPIPKTLGRIVEGSAAERAGLLAGDEVLALDGQSVSTWEEWTAYVRERPETSVAIQVKRGSELKDLTLIPERIELDNGDIIGRAGVYAQQPSFPEEMWRRYEYGPISAFTSALTETWDAGSFILLSVKKLIFGEISTKNLSGPIGIAKVAASHAEHGFWAFLSFLAHLSVVLGILNLLPIPIVDGGHIVFCLVEWVKGSPVSQSVQAWSMNFGIAMLFGVMVLAFYNDILRL